MSTANELPSLADRLKDAVVASRLTQREVAKRSGVNFRSLQEYLSGRTRMPADALPGIARALNVSSDWLLTGEPAALDPASLWAALDEARSSPAGDDPGSEDFVRLVYLHYSLNYVATLSRVGETSPHWACLERFNTEFIERLHDESDPRIAMMRRRQAAPGAL